MVALLYFTLLYFYAKPATSAGKNTLTAEDIIHKHRELHPLLFSKSVWATLTSHRELINIEDICETRPTVYIVLIREDLKV